MSDTTNSLNDRGSIAAGLRVGLDALADPLRIVPPMSVRERGEAGVDVSVRPPGSKSLTNRLLLLAGLCAGESVLRRPLTEADDARRMLAALEQLGCAVERSDDGQTVRVTGVGGRWRVARGDSTINLNNAGTATRFLAAASLLADGPITIDGNERMRARPIGELGEALRTLGATVEHLGGAGCPPMRVTPPAGNVPAVSTIEFGATQSSQFISALLLAAPFLPDGLTVKLVGEPTSASYVRMTVNLLDALGASLKLSADGRVIRVGPGLDAFDVDVEPDASGSTYFLAAGALLREGTVRVRGFTAPSEGREPLQGDALFADELAGLGCRVSHVNETIVVRPPEGVSDKRSAWFRPVMTDLKDMPDAAMTLAVCCCFASGTSILRGVKTLRVKECDRIAALKSELGKIGVEVIDNLNGDPDAMSITPPGDGIDLSPDAPAVEMETFDDHRMAMSLALVGLRRHNVLIKDPGCVAKTYPGYWAEFSTLYV